MIFVFLASESPENFNLPNDYTFAEISLGNLFYKIYNTNSNYSDAKAQCESDGAFLAIPRSQGENDFFAGLIPEVIWIGINDIEEEGNFVAVDGRDISWTNWGTAWNGVSEPNGGANENAVELNPLWNDTPESSLKKFVCSFNIEGIIFSSFES